MLIDIINHGEICPLSGVVLILVVLGRLFASQQQQRWGCVLAVVALLGYGVYAIAEFPPGSSQELFVLTVRAVTFGGLVLGLSWLALPLITGALRPVVNHVRHSTATSRAWIERLEKDRGSNKRFRPDIADLERAQRTATAAAAKKANATKRIEDARAAVEVLYALHRPEIASRLPQETFDDFVRRHLGDERLPEYVEERSLQLQQIIQQHLHKIQPPSSRSPAEERGAARDMVDRYYQTHLDLLRDIYPIELVQASLQAEMTEQTEPTQCWATCHRLLITLQEHVAEERGRRAAEDAKHGGRTEELRAAEKELAVLRSRLEQVRRNDANAPVEVVENDAEGLEEDIRILEQTLARLRKTT